MRKLILLLNLFLFFGCELFNPTDFTKPTLTINYPESNDELSIRATILITADDDIGIKKVECEIIDNINSTIIIDDSYPFELPVLFLENHNEDVIIECKAYDESNNKSKIHSIDIKINNDKNPLNGYHDGDELFKSEISSINQITENFSNEYHTWEFNNGLNRITELRYRNIHIETIPNSIENLSQLTYLEFINDSLTSIPESIAKLSLLEVIRFQNNQISEIPESIINLKKLEIIDFSENYIEVLPLNFEDLGCDECRLKILKLQNNNINYINLSSFSHLEVLWLANNNINDINLSCNNTLWHSSYDQLNPTITLFQNNLCAEPNSYGWCIDSWEIGVQNCE